MKTRLLLILAFLGSLSLWEWLWERFVRTFLFVAYVVACGLVAAAMAALSLVGGVIISAFLLLRLVRR